MTDELPTDPNPGPSLRELIGAAPAVPEVTPIDWQHLGSELAAGLVKASAAVETVMTDGQVGNQYRYATTAAVVAASRVALAAGELALPLTSYRVQANIMSADFVLLHKSNQASPTITVSIPVVRMSDATKAIGATLSYLRKYTAAAVLGIGWVDPGEDVDQQTAPKQPTHATQRRDTPQTRAPQPQKTGAVSHMDRLLEKAKGANRALLDAGLHPELLYSYSTGVTGGMPDKPAGSELLAIVIAGQALAHSKEHDLELPLASHDGLVAYVREHTDIVMAWQRGEVTDRGRKADAAVASQVPGAK